MNNWKENKPLQFFLALLLVSIWGYNIFQLWDGFTTALPPQNVANVHRSVSRLDSLDFSYRSNFRDPFMPYRYLPDSLLPVKDTLTTPPAAPEIPPFPEYIPPPPYYLRGIVGNIAILEDTQTGESLLKKQGETVGMYTLHFIGNSMVKLKYKTQFFVLTMLPT
jgi:hypothetical protein